jgi:hypothetical protein
MGWERAGTACQEPDVSLGIENAQNAHAEAGQLLIFHHLSVLVLGAESIVELCHNNEYAHKFDEATQCLFLTRTSPPDPSSPHPDACHVISGDDAIWTTAESALVEALDAKGWHYSVDAGGGAFYGPKIDIKIQVLWGAAVTHQARRCDAVTACMQSDF